MTENQPNAPVSLIMTENQPNASVSLNMTEKSTKCTSLLKHDRKINLMQQSP